MKGVVLVVVCVLFLGIVSANLGVILEEEDEVIVDFLDKKNIDFEIILDSEINEKNLSDYDSFILGDERLRNSRKIDFSDKDVLIMNRKVEEFGLDFFEVGTFYTKKYAFQYGGEKLAYENYWRYLTKYFLGLPFYFVEGEEDVAYVEYGQNKKGQIVSKKENYGKKCFYGIPKTDYWTEDSENLFEDCLNFVLNSEQEESEVPDEGDENIEEGEYYCESEDNYRSDCLSFSGGAGTRCYLDIEKSSWDYCSSGWVSVN